MVGAMRPAHAGFPNRGTEDYHRQKEEHPNNLKPDNSANAPEWPQKSTNATSNSLGSLSGDYSSGMALRSAGGPSLWLSASGLNGNGWFIGGSFGAGRYTLAGNAAGDSKADSNSTTDGLRFHSQFDGNSAPLFQFRPSFRPGLQEMVGSSRLLSGGVGSKV